MLSVCPFYCAVSRYSLAIARTVVERWLGRQVVARFLISPGNRERAVLYMGCQHEATTVRLHSTMPKSNDAPFAVLTFEKCHCYCCICRYRWLDSSRSCSLLEKGSTQERAQRRLAREMTLNPARRISTTDTIGICRWCERCVVFLSVGHRV